MGNQEVHTTLHFYSIMEPIRDIRFYPNLNAHNMSSTAITAMNTAPKCDASNASFKIFRLNS